MKPVHNFVSGTIVAIIVLTAPFAVAQPAPVDNGTVATAPQPAREPEFGKRGQWYVYTPNLSVAHSRQTSDPKDDHTAFSLGAESGAFVRDHLSLGLRIDGEYGWQHMQPFPNADSLRFSHWMTRLSVVAGWQRPLSSWVSFWPKLLLGGYYARSEQLQYDPELADSAKRRASVYAIDASVRLPVVLHVTRHLFVEFAYQVYAGYWRNNSAQARDFQFSTQTSFGLGAWF